MGHAPHIPENLSGSQILARRRAPVGGQPCPAEPINAQRTRSSAAPVFAWSSPVLACAGRPQRPRSPRRPHEVDGVVCSARSVRPRPSAASPAVRPDLAATRFLTARPDPPAPPQVLKVKDLPPFGCLRPVLASSL
jgi:hypothetical protein